MGYEALQALLDDDRLTEAYERDGRPITTGLLEAATVSARGTLRPFRVSLFRGPD